MLLAGAAVFSLGDGRVALFGGVNSTHRASAAVLILDTTVDEPAWQRFDPPPDVAGSWPAARAFAAPVRAAGRTLLHGGHDGDRGVFGDLWRFLPATALDAAPAWRPLDDCRPNATGFAACPRASMHAAAGLGGALVVVGGRDAAGQAQRAVWLQDVLSGSWTEGPPAPAAVFGHACASVLCDGCRATLPAAVLVTFGAGAGHWAPLSLVPGAALLRPPDDMLSVLAPLLVVALAGSLLGAVVCAGRLTVRRPHTPVGDEQL
jgi:hypothetical protein